ncbi:hypothetical protein BGX38DRAFT_242696 [Terfezia claveryi]|nr:hypothetical protein BGX38DRAFT_242696 [Terfezia claveryi]
MDALASLCVSKARGEVIAIGAQIIRKDNRARLVLTVAGNHPTHELLTKIPHHLRVVWGNLQQLARLYELERSEAKPGTFSNQRSSSPPSSVYVDPRQKPVISILLQALLQHHFAKVHQRFHKRFPKFLSFRQIFLAIPDEAWPNKLIKAKTELSAVSCSIRDMADCFNQAYSQGKWTVTSTVLTKLSTLLENICVRTSQIDPVEMALLEGVVEQHGAASFPLGHYLRKLSTFHRSASSLIRWAQSPRLRHTLKDSLEIQIVTLKPEFIPQFPTTSAGWEEVVKNIVERNDFLPEGSFIQEAATAVCKSFSHSPKAAPPVHCEVALILHYQSRPVSSVPPFNYIGVSKLSCGACWEWIQQFNSENNTTYVVKGAHKKFYYPWGIPEHLSMGFWKRYTIRLEHIVCERWQVQGSIRSGSDSTANSGNEIVVTNTVTLALQQDDPNWVFTYEIP